MTCKHCAGEIRRCPAAGWPAHKDGINCKGWLHNGATTYGTHLAEPETGQ